MSASPEPFAAGHPPTGDDRFAAARAVADAVLYEGYVLYPYRASAKKNQLRWQFGVLAPPALAADGSERSSMRTEVLVDAGRAPRLTVRLRFLQVQRRSLEVASGDGFVPTDQLAVDATSIAPWDEAVEHEVELDPISLSGDAVSIERELPLAGGEEVVEVHDRAGTLVGRTMHRRERVDGVVTVAARQLEGPTALIKVAVTVENTSPWDQAEARRDDVVLRSLVAVHTLLAVDDGVFVSSLDPPEYAAAAIAACRNEGTFPVLAGGDGGADVVLSSPIILYDHPAVAPESAGDFCDATEIDEILALRVMTLTDEEKAEARGTDARAAAIIDRCDDMPPEMWARLHGAIRSLQPLPGTDSPASDPFGGSDGFDGFGGLARSDGLDTNVPWWDPGTDGSVDPWTDSLFIGGQAVCAGTRVRLHPTHRADAHDFFYADREATVKGIFRDVDGEEHVAVAIDGDLVAEELDWQGRYLYFHPDEIEVVG